MRTSAELTQQEIAVFQKWAADKNLVMDGEIGERNGTLIGEFVMVKMDSDLTEASLAAALPHLRDQLVFRNADQSEYEKVYALLSPDEQVAFKQWNMRDLEQTHRNSWLVLRFIKDRHQTVTTTSLQNAVTNIASHAGPQLAWKPAPARKEAYSPHSESSRIFAPKSDTNRNITASKHNHAKDSEYAPQPRGTSASADDSRWWDLANNLAGRTHGQTAEIMKIIKSSGRETYETRVKLLQGRKASI